MSVRQAMKAPRWKWLLIILFWTAYATCFMKWLQGSYVALITLPWLGSLVTFHVAHDASHGALSTRPWLNELLTFSSFLVGAPHEWYWQHVALHHVWILGNKKKQHFFPAVLKYLQRVRLFQLPGCVENGIPPNAQDQHCWCGSGCEARPEMGEGQGTLECDAGGVGHCSAELKVELPCPFLGDTSLPYISLRLGWFVGARAPFFLNISGNNTLDISDFFSWLNICWTFLYGKYPGKSELWPRGLPLRCLSVCKCSILIVAHLFPVRYIYVRLYLCQFLRLSNLQLIDVQLIVKLLMHTCSVITNIYLYLYILYLCLGIWNCWCLLYFPSNFTFCVFHGSFHLRLCHFSAWDHWSWGDGCPTGLHRDLFLFVALVPWQLKKKSQVINLCFWDVKMMCSS